MRRQIVQRFVLAALIATGLTLACDQPTSKIPTDPSLPASNTVVIVGPSSIAPGQSAQFVANMRLADGTVKSGATAMDVTWRSSDTSVLQVSSSGIVTPVANQGDAIITADVRLGEANRSGSREAIVQPDGTFRLVGQVTEQGASSIVVQGARVEVESGSPFAITDKFGRYRLYGVPPTANLRISANAYDTTTFAVSLTGNTTRNFALDLVGSRPSLAGNYTLLIDVVGTCPGAQSLPPDLQHRRYDALLNQSGSVVEVLLSGAQFRLNSASRGNHFTGVATSAGAVFTLDSFDYYYSTSYPSVAELLPDGRVLVPQGTVTTTGSAASGFSGTAPFGGLVLWDATFPSFYANFLGGCFGPTSLKLIPK